jgi:hypothetical protein
MRKTVPYDRVVSKGPEGWCTMFRLLIGVAIGYVLGSRAGRERYEQIKRWAAAVVDHPAVQGAAGVVRAKVGEVIPGK